MLWLLWYPQNVFAIVYGHTVITTIIMFLLQKVIEGITDRTEVVFAVLYHNHASFHSGFFPPMEKLFLPLSGASL